MTTFAFFIPQIGPMELCVILGIGVLLFGKRLPEVGRSVGQGILELRRSMKAVTDEVEDTNKELREP